MEPCAWKDRVGGEGVVGGNKSGGTLLPNSVGMKRQQRKQQAGHKTKSREKRALTRERWQRDAVPSGKGL